ncbi:anti-sigma factor family protein [Streptomyces niger]|uniref:anti-sigma factor family protein n=1 Tax=Streptomyces niger TaxID=66373 RepID=UPI00069BD625|nr:zf-HC2 domain-containing protein [Streptomyces niger]
MTSTTDTGGHPEVAEISALADGLLSPGRAVELRSHLDDCPLCEDVHSSLEEIRDLLGTLPGPGRMPDDVVGRIDAALAAEALLDATAPAGEPALVPAAAGDSSWIVAQQSTGPEDIGVSRETPETKRGDVSRETAPSRARTSSADRPAGYPRSATGPGRKTPGTRTTRAHRWPKVLLGTAAAAAVLGIGGILLQNGSAKPTHEHDPGVNATETNTGNPALSSATLGSHVRDLLDQPRRSKAPDVGTQSSPQTPLRGADDTIPSCVKKGLGRPEKPLAATRDTYRGKTAYLVVLPHPSDVSRVSAYVVSASCVSASPPAPGKILLSGVYPRD